MAGTTIVSVEDVSKRFILHKDKSLKERALYFGRSSERREDFWALRDINLSIESGTTLGLVGHNGSGKSTLLKIIGGIIEPSSGIVQQRGRLAALLELGAGFHPDLSGRENVYLNAAILGLSRKETDKYFDSIVEFAEIENFIDTQVKFYSSGMYVRLAFAVAIHVDPDLLLVDEVLAVGDEPFQRKCLDKIAEFQREGRTILFVSHSAEQIARLCNRVVVLDGGKLIHDGDAESGLTVLREHYARRGSSFGERTSDGPYVLRDAQTEVTHRGNDVDVLMRMQVEIVRPEPAWGIALSIYTTVGLRLFSTTSFDKGLQLPNTVGTHTVELRMPNAGLGGGTYMANIAIGDGRGGEFDRMNGVASFTVSNAPGGEGLVRLDPQFRVDDSR